MAIISAQVDQVASNADYERLVSFLNNRGHWQGALAGGIGRGHSQGMLLLEAPTVGSNIYLDLSVGGFDISLLLRFFQSSSG